MVDIIAAAVLLAIVGMAARYMHNEKKRGVTCVGCPHAKQCAARKNGHACSGTEKAH